MGRPPMQNTEKKENITGVRLRGEERVLIQMAADASGKKLSEWMRNVLVAAASSELNSKPINAS